MLTGLMPVRSPLPASAVAAGFLALLSPRRAEAARAEIEAVLCADADRRILLVDSGTSALSLGLRCTASTPARPVAIPAFACYDIATAIDGAGVPFVLYDIDPATLGPDMESLRRALAAGADRIVVVHLYGIPVDLSAVSGLAREYGATVIEDAAQGAGATWEGRPLGRHGSLGVLSFGRGKGVTGGRGGALIGNDPFGREVLLRAQCCVGTSSTSAREVLALTAQWLLARRALYWIPVSLPFLGLGETTSLPPHRATAVSALSLGVLSRTERGVAREAERRRRHAARLLAQLNPARLHPVRPINGSTPGYLRLPVLLREVLRVRDASQARRLGIMPSYPRILADLDGFGARQLGGSRDFPGAIALAERLITLPVHSALTDGDLTRLEEWCRA